MAVSPSVVYFGRTPLSDTPMLTFSVAARARLRRLCADRRRRPWRSPGPSSLALAGLVEDPGDPRARADRRSSAVLRHGWQRVARSVVRRRAAGRPRRRRHLVPARRSDLTWRPDSRRPSSGRRAPIAADIAQWAGMFTTVSHWTRADHLTWETATQARHAVLGAAPDPAVRRGRRSSAPCAGTGRWPAAPWSTSGPLAAAALIAVSLQGQIFHEFHQLPALPPLALYFGMGAAPLFDGAHLPRLRRPGARWRIGAVAGAARLGRGPRLRGQRRHPPALPAR